MIIPLENLYHCPLLLLQLEVPSAGGQHPEPDPKLLPHVRPQWGGSQHEGRGQGSFHEVSGNQLHNLLLRTLTLATNIEFSIFKLSE